MSWRSCKVCQDRLNPRSAVGRKWSCALMHALSTSMQKFRPVGSVWACTPPWLSLAFPDAISARGGGNIEACGGTNPPLWRSVGLPSSSPSHATECCEASFVRLHQTLPGGGRNKSRRSSNERCAATSHRRAGESPILTTPTLGARSWKILSSGSLSSFAGTWPIRCYSIRRSAFCTANRNSVSNCLYCDFFADWWCWPSLAPLVSRAAADNLCLH